MGPLPRESKVNQKIQKCLTEVYGHTFTSCHYEALFARLEKSQGLIKKIRKAHWDEGDVVLITYADQFHGAGKNRYRRLISFIMNGLSRHFLMCICCHFIRGHRMMVFP
uniref:Sucrose phosphorylase n=1 Tax=Enterobacter hormaechei TaxID=158836 RepID=A0A286NZ44_9ENTR|nr:sucrose phosphorylase [Enterobacter hormaechei]